MDNIAIIFLISSSLIVIGGMGGVIANRMN